MLELYRTLEQLLVDLQARGGQWGHLLDKLAVVNVQHMAILQQLRPLTRNFVLHPKAPSTAQALAQHAAGVFACGAGVQLRLAKPRCHQGHHQHTMQIPLLLWLCPHHTLYMHSVCTLNALPAAQRSPSC